MERLDFDRYREVMGNTKGNVSPPYPGEEGHEFDRPAHYDFAGKLYDAHGRRIIPGKALTEKELEEEAPPPPQAQEQPPEDDQVGPVQLLAQSNTMPFSKFEKEAKRILGPDCPKSKPQIIAALAQAITSYEERRAKRSSGAQGMTWGGMNSAPPANGAGPKGGMQLAQPPAAAPAPPAPAPAPAGKGDVDLVAWGRGQRNHLVGELIKAFRQQHNVQITNGPRVRKDMRDWLIDQKIITAAEARQDVEP